MTQLLVGTKKGLFAPEGTAGEPFAITGRWFAGEPVEYAMCDPRNGRAFACLTSRSTGPSSSTQTTFRASGSRPPGSRFRRTRRRQ